MESRFGVCEARVRSASPAGVLALECDYRQTTGAFTTADYDAFRKGTEHVISLIERPLVFRPAAAP